MYRNGKSRQKITMKKLTVTIGIPAYNEEVNIGHLLGELGRQHSPYLTIKKIIVASDGSNDTTVSVAQKSKVANLEVIANRQRAGLVAILNQIIDRTNTDILILFNADILLADTSYLEKLVAPILTNSAEMTASFIKPLPAQGFFEHVLFVSNQVKNILFQNFKGGNNVYTCYGPAQAFAKKFYRKLTFTHDDGEDMYAFFKCLRLGFRFRHIPESVTYYRLPTTLSDHLKQSIRYQGAQKDMFKMFPPILVTRELYIPRRVYVVSAIKSLPILLTYPVHAGVYLGVYLYSKLQKAKWASSELWNVTSSKMIGAYYGKK